MSAGAHGAEPILRGRQSDGSDGSDGSDNGTGLREADVLCPVGQVRQVRQVRLSVFSLRFAQSSVPVRRQILPDPT